MNRMHIVAVAWVVCGSGSAPSLMAQERVDRRAAEAAMMKADADFNRAVADRDMTRFLSLIAEDATFSGGLPNQLRGKDAVAKAWARFFQKDGPTLTWKPTKAEALVGGEIGYTVGTSERRVRGADGKVAVTRGNYVTVWKKQPDGRWLAVFDTGSEEPRTKN